MGVHRRAIARATIVAIAVCTASSSASGDGQAAPAGPVRLRAVRVTTSGVAPATVTLDADGPLPEPRSEPLDGPPRIFLDLDGVRPATAVAVEGSDALVVRIRFAINRVSPLRTRVVIDLTRPTPYRVDTSARAQGRLVVVLSGSGREPGVQPPAIQPPAIQPPAVERRSVQPAVPPPAAAAPRPPSADDGYAVLIRTSMDRLLALRPMLVSIDRRDAKPDGEFAAAAGEFDALARIFDAIKPPPSRQATHELLVRACALGARATRLGQDAIRTGDMASSWTAASAAAGALLMLDRAANDLGQPVAKKP